MSKVNQLKKDKRMDKKKNGCKIIVDFRCDYYAQKSCSFYQIDTKLYTKVKTTVCRWGLYKRPCFNTKAKQEVLSIFIKQFSGENDAKSS